MKITEELAARIVDDITGITGDNIRERCIAITATHIEQFERKIESKFRTKIAEHMREEHEGHEPWCERSECNCGKKSAEKEPRNPDLTSEERAICHWCGGKSSYCGNCNS